jgi:hypothetical protein
MISGSALGFSPAGVRRSFITSLSAAGPDMGDASRHNKRSERIGGNAMRLHARRPRLEGLGWPSDLAGGQR